ncbi:unnamed protein product [Rotaria sp. Silwood2]|nr:unnamed protein product [Rotaria sp. Silwood2]CAF4170414.1 unnamed protein product [Rotaria sp. Silwood2]
MQMRFEHWMPIGFILLWLPGAHSDDGSLTFVFQHDNKSGLEIFDRSTNVWHPVEARDNMIVVNFEDVF